MGHVFASTPGYCVVVVTPPAGQALIVDHVILNEITIGEPVHYSDQVQAGEVLNLWADPAGDCSSNFGSIIATSSPSQPGDVTVSFAPGYAIPAGYQLDIRYSFFTPNASTIATAYGYAVPASDVAATPQDALHGHKLELRLKR
jgi:hypothetical protein